MRGLLVPKLEASNQPIQWYQCPECSKLYKWKKSLITHLRYQCQKPPRFICLHCGHRKYQKIHILRHMRTIHPDLPELFQDNATINVIKKLIILSNVIRQIYICHDLSLDLFLCTNIQILI